MNPTIIASLIAFFGVGVSTIITLVVNNRMYRISNRKMYREIEQDYSRELLKKRIEVYPLLYEEFSEFIKIMLIKERITFEQFSTFFERTNALNSKISIFFSGETGKVSYKLWVFLRDKIAAMKMDQVIEEPNELRELKKAIQKVEISLKKDLGVYIVEFNDGERKMKLNPDYRDIPSEVEVIR